MKHRGIEEPKVSALTGKQLREPALGVVFDQWHSDDIPSVTIVDGHHRLVRRYRGGITFLDVHVCMSYIWQNCLIRYTPEGDALIAANMPPKVTDGIELFSVVQSVKG